MSELTFIYLNISEVEVEGKRYLTELGWVIEDPFDDEIRSTHYFVNHPGAEQADRLILAALGGESEPPPRYAAATILTMLFGDVPASSVLVPRSFKHKRMLHNHAEANSIDIPAPVHLMSDVLTSDDRDDILALMEKTRTRALTPTGETK